MNRIIYAASELCADLWYESGFAAPDPFLWFQTEQETAVVVSPLELGRAQKQCRPGTTVIDAKLLRQHFNLAPDSADTPQTTSRNILTISHALGVKRWSVPETFPLALARKLEKAGLKLDIVAPFSPLREVKIASEIEAIRHSEQLAEAGMAAADALLQKSTIGKDDWLFVDGVQLTAEMLQGAINGEIARLGGVAAGTIAAPGPQGADPHQVGHGPIKAHQPIVIDIFPRDTVTGYHGDLTRTRVKGQAPEVVQKAYDTVLAIQTKVLETLRPGVLGRDMQKMVSDYFQSAGYETKADPATGVYQGFFHGLGHGLGMEIHEYPHLNARVEPPLVPGNVVTVEPGLYYPEWGGIRIEDSVAITANGIDNLATITKALVIP